LFIAMIVQPYIKGFTARHAGKALISQPVVMAVFSPLADRLSDKIEQGPLLPSV
jgi:hypothetical protein